MSVTLTEILLLVITAASVFLAVGFFRMAKQLTQTAEEIEQTAERVNGMMPKVQGLIDSANAELAQLRGLTATSNAVVSDVKAISGEVRTGLTVLGLARRSQAAIAGAKAGIATLQQFTNQSSNGRGGL